MRLPPGPVAKVATAPSVAQVCALVHLSCPSVDTSCPYPGADHLEYTAPKIQIS